MVYLLVWSGLLFSRYYAAPVYSFQVSVTLVCCEAAVFWMSLVTFFHAVFDEGFVDGSGAYFMLFGLLFVMVGICVLIHRRYSKWIKLDFNEIERPKEAIVYMGMLSKMVS